MNSVDKSRQARLEHYEKMAADADGLVLIASDPRLKREYARIAASWRRLAEHVSSVVWAADEAGRHDRELV